jgi:N-acetylmuramoyl-L-alanine amidase
VVLDPGHGGDDPGARGPGETEEKTIALAVARRIRSAIETRLGVRVLLTRDEDRPVSIDDRVAYANNNKADLFLSLHVNASFRATSSGASIYVATFSETERERGTSAAARLPGLGGGSREVELVAWDVAQSHHLTRSTAFARLLEAELSGQMPTTVGSTGAASMRVLESANMPAVLVELGYLSNPTDVERLTSAGSQAAIANAVVDAIARLKAELDGNRGTQ